MNVGVAAGITAMGSMVIASVLGSGIIFSGQIFISALVIAVAAAYVVDWGFKNFHINLDAKYQRFLIGLMAAFVPMILFLLASTNFAPCTLSAYPSITLALACQQFNYSSLNALLQAILTGPYALAIIGGLIINRFAWRFAEQWRS